MSGLVRREDHGAVAVLELNRPEKLNALSPELFEELAAHLDAIEAEEAVRCVLLCGAGRSFCAGADVAVLRAGHVTEDPEFRSKTVERLGNLRAILFVAVQGHCYTGGLELALTGDVIVASDAARFCDTHARMGILPRWGLSARLPRRVGLMAARRMSMTGAVVGAEEALRIGLCDHVVPGAELRDRALALAREAAESDPGAVAGLRVLYARGLEMPLEQALIHERGFSATPKATT